jgi:hypothetical protein
MPSTYRAWRTEWRHPLLLKIPRNREMLIRTRFAADWTSRIDIRYKMDADALNPIYCQQGMHPQHVETEQCNGKTVQILPIVFHVLMTVLDTH